MSYIHTREQLKQHIHNFLRNNGIGYGMNALKVFSFFYGLKIIEDDLHLLQLSDDCKFSSLITMDSEKLVELIDRVSEEIHNSKLNLKTIIFSGVQIKYEKSVYKKIVNMIDTIPNSIYDANTIQHNERQDYYDVNLQGKIYEYFIGRDATAISELGAYFTDRHITNFILDKMNISVDKNNNVPTMIDPFGGSGGFTLSYVNRFKNVDWSQNIQNIYHYDMNEDVVKYVGLEIFTMTKQIWPFKEEKNIKRENSFYYEFENKKYHFVISNPPYGGDDYKKTPIQEEMELIIRDNDIEIKNYLLTLMNDKEFKRVKTNFKRCINNIKNKEKVTLDDFYEEKYKKRLTLDAIQIPYDSSNIELDYILNLIIQNYDLQGKIDAIITEEKKKRVCYETCCNRIKKLTKEIVIKQEIDFVENALQHLNNLDSNNSEENKVITDTINKYINKKTKLENMTEKKDIEKIYYRQCQHKQ